MTIVVDPAKNEVRALARVTPWRGKRVLEIGCGDGRLSLRLARLGARVQAIDPDDKLIRLARKTLPKRFAARAGATASVAYHTGHAEALDYPDESFDLVVFAWAL